MQNHITLGIESSCDETGIALYHSEQGLLSHAIHSQIALHNEYGGVVPELASRDHAHRVIPLVRQVCSQANIALQQINGIAYTQGPGLSGALLVGASVANALAFSLAIPTIAIHHMEGHLLSPLLSEAKPQFPFIALLVSGGHTQLMQVNDIGDYLLLGESLDDAAGEAFDKTAKLLGLNYPGGPELARLAKNGRPNIFKLPRPMLKNNNLDFSFSGLKTAVLTLSQQHEMTEQAKADLAYATQEAIVDVLCKKSIRALKQTGLNQLVVAGGVGANLLLRQQLTQTISHQGGKVFYPELAYCTDNGAMIAYAGSLRFARQQGQHNYQFSVRPRWPLAELQT